MFVVIVVVFFFFFSSRRRHTRLQGDWSSDVCSPICCLRRTARSCPGPRRGVIRRAPTIFGLRAPVYSAVLGATAPVNFRSEERRVGKECRSRWAPAQAEKKRMNKQIGAVLKYTVV